MTDTTGGGDRQCQGIIDWACCPEVEVMRCMKAEFVLTVVGIVKWLSQWYTQAVARNRKAHQSGYIWGWYTFRHCLLWANTNLDSLQVYGDSPATDIMANLRFTAFAWLSTGSSTMGAPVTCVAEWLAPYHVSSSLAPKDGGRTRALANLRQWL